MTAIGRSFLWAAFAMLGLMLCSLTVTFVALPEFQTTFSGLGFFALNLIPMPFMWAAMWPRNPDEKYVAPLAFGNGFSAKSSWRRMLKGPFAPYQGRPNRNWKQVFADRYVLVGLMVGAICLFSGSWILPVFSYFAFLLSLRRAAFSGNVVALKIERNILKLRYPTKACITSHRLLA